MYRDNNVILAKSLTPPQIVSGIWFNFHNSDATQTPPVHILAATLFAALILMRYTLTFCAVLMVVTLGIVISSANALLVLWGIYLSPAPFVLTLVTSFILLGLIRFRSEEIHALQYVTDLGNAQNCAILGTGVHSRDTRSRDGSALRAHPELCTYSGRTSLIPPPLY